MSLFLANIIGFVTANWRLVAAIVGATLLTVLISVAFRSCGSKPAKLNEAEIQRGEQAVKEQNQKELAEILTAAEVREKAIDGNLANAKADTLNATHSARQKYSGMTVEQLQAEFDKKK